MGFIKEGDKKLYEFSGELRHETDAAYLVDAGLEEPVWLPKSQTTHEDDTTFLVPEWLAQEKGII